MNEELDVKQILKFMYQRKNILICILLISLIVGVLYTFVIKRPLYESNTQILIDKADASIENYITGNDILKSKSLDVKFDKASKIIKVTATNRKKDEAFNEVNSYMDVVEKKLQETYGIKTFKILETPQVAETPNNASYIKDILECLIIGIIGYIGYIIVLINFIGIINASKIENIAKINVLGKVSMEKMPKNKMFSKKTKEQIKYRTSNEKIKNELKRIETNIELNKEIEKPKIITFTGVNKESGTTYIVNNLAIQYTKIYSKVLIIDANVFTKTISKEYKLESKEGFTNIIEDSSLENIENRIKNTEIENLYVLPVGNIEIEEEKFLQGTLENILKILKNNYDIILIDTTSINEKVIPMPLVKVADATIIVVKEEKTKVEDVEKAKIAIENIGGKISGAILNKVN